MFRGTWEQLWLWLSTAASSSPPRASSPPTTPSRVSSQPLLGHTTWTNFRAGVYISLQKLNYSPVAQKLGAACRACRQDRQEQLQAAHPLVPHLATEHVATPPQGWITSNSRIIPLAVRYVRKGSVGKIRKKKARRRKWRFLLENDAAPYPHHQRDRICNKNA